MDAKDILGGIGIGIGIGGIGKNPQEKKSKATKEQHRKPDGISREVYMLTGGVAPLMPAVDIKKQTPPPPPPSNEKVTWQWSSFTNSARKDDLHLYHWVRVVNGVPPTGDYPFAKYNKSVDVIKYTDEEYHNYLAHPKWTKEETDSLFDLCQRFDLRFLVVADRFPTPRTVEELKDRYYSASRTILVARAPNPAHVADHPLVKEPYNAQQETERKRALSMVLSQSKYQERKDAELLAEAKRIQEARLLSKAAEVQDKPSATNPAAEHTELSPDEISPSASAAAIAAVETVTIPASVRMLPVYLRTYALDKMVEAANSTAGPRAIKRVEEALQDLGVHLKPKVPTKAVCAEHLELRKEILTLLNLQKQLQYKAADGSSYLDGAYADAPGTPKGRVGDHDRPFIPDTLNFSGDRVGKRDHKRKGPGRPPDVPNSPANKRPRKFKTDG